MPSSRSDSGRPVFSGVPDGVTDSRVRKAVHGAGWHKLSDGTRAALVEFYDRSGGLDIDEFEEGLAELIRTHTDLQDLVTANGEFNENSDPRGTDMPAEPDPGAAGLPDPFGSANAQQPPPPPPPPPSGGEPQTRS